jgi:hypothetical protein
MVGLDEGLERRQGGAAVSKPKRYDDVIDMLTDQCHKYAVENARLKAEVERLTKAVMHSPAAQLKLKELEGKTTFEEINPKDDNSNINTELLALSNRQASDIRRLTKAGDLMCRMAGNNQVINRHWKTAKKGKQP